MSDTPKVYRFEVNAGLVTAVYELEDGAFRQVTVDADEQWTIEDGQIVKTEYDDGRLERTVYADADGDGLYLRVSTTYESSGSTPGRPAEGYQFTIENGAITAVFEIEDGVRRQVEVEAEETWTIRGDTVVKVEQGYQGSEESVYSDPDGDGVYGKVSTVYTDASGAVVDVSALEGDDDLNGDDGDDYVHGEAGRDHILGAGGDDELHGDDGDDFVRGGDGDDDLSGEDGFDDLHGNIGQDTLAGGRGGDWVVGGQGDDRLDGEDDDDVVLGNLGADSLLGGLGNDVVRGGQQDDTLSGGDGDDWMSGDRGDDDLTGGAGADIFNLFSGAGSDVIHDFDGAAGDRIHIEDDTPYSLGQVGADVVITLQDGAQYTLQGVSLANFQTGWIID